MYTIGLDIGGTKISAALVDQEGRCFNQQLLPSIVDSSEKMFQQVVRCINNVIKEGHPLLSKVSGMGIGVPGKVDIDKGIAVFQNNLPWRNFPLAERLRNIYNIPVVIDNDVRMAAYGEWANSNKDDNTFVYITWSTGIASCMIINRQILKGSGFAGEIGLSYVDSSGERLENMVSGPALSRKTKMLIDNQLDVKELMVQYKKGNEAATSIINETVEKLARSIYSIICLLDPGKIILGGSVISNNSFLLDILLSYLRQMMITEQFDAINRLSVSNLNGEAGMIGAGLNSWNAVLIKENR
jgi:glucokinase